ncbi:MAG: response regulator [Myxococcota bacterium]|nr:response regulator [Myxococcota bacterium]
MNRDRAVTRTESAPVLLVDDTPANLLALTAVLSSLDLSIVAARSATEAIGHVERGAFAVALIDVQMPDMDGFELTRRLRGLEFGRELPVLFVTAIHGDEAYVKKGYASGGADYITKPYDPQVIRARVKAFVDLYQQREAVRRGQVALRTQERDEAVRRLVALERIATAALETSDLQSLLEELLRAFTEAADVADFAVVLLRDGAELKVAAAVGLEGDAIQRFSVEVGEGFAGRVADERRAIELSDPAGTKLAVDVLGESGVRGLYGIPLMHGGQVLGVAQIGSVRESSFSDAEKRLFAAAADRAALAVAKHLQLSDLHQILSTAPAYIAIVRVPGNGYSFVNSAYLALFGRELVGTSTHAEYGLGPEAEQAVERVRQTGQSVLIEEMQVPGLGPRGGTLYLRFAAQPMRNATGGVERVLMFSTDVTAQVVARQEIEATHAMRAELLDRERAARKAAELASIAKDDFLAAVSHELRTPLNAILGWASLARSQKVPDLDRALAVIERNALAQARIVEDVLDFSRIARGKMRLSLSSVDIALVTLEALETVRPAAEAKSIQLDVDLDVHQKLVGDAQRLQQVAWNLLTNAIKFTRNGGRVAVRASDAPGKVALSVTDTGQGIDAEFLPYVFEPFRQASSGSTRAHGGLGLGLSIVKQIVLAHGGTVRVESPGIDRGTTFSLEFPAEAPKLAHASNGAPVVPLRDGDVRSILKPLRVLVVDDDEDSREFLSCALTERGATVVSASGAAEALRELESFRPDVLVSDIAMPEADGYSLMRQVRALPPELGGAVPAVALTAHARKDAWEHARAAGFQLLEAKPVDLDHLTAAIASLRELPLGRALP